MGRPQRPIPDDDTSPEAEFARELRRLRESAGNPTLAHLARRTGYSDTTLSAAMSGRGRPSLDVALALVTALGGDGPVWEARWRALPGPAGSTVASAPTVLPADAEETPSAVAVADPPAADAAPPPGWSRRPLVLAAAVERAEPGLRQVAERAVVQPHAVPEAGGVQDRVVVVGGVAVVAVRRPLAGGLADDGEPVAGVQLRPGAVQPRGRQAFSGTVER